MLHISGGKYSHLVKIYHNSVLQNYVKIINKYVFAMTIISSLVMICIYYSFQPLQFPEQVLVGVRKSRGSRALEKPAGRFCSGCEGSEMLGQ